jgi:signal transduction histidine kinase
LDAALAPAPEDAAARTEAAARRRRELIAVAEARVANAWLRLGSCTLVAAVASSVTGDYWPFVWLAGFCVVVLVDRVVFTRVLKHCQADGDAHMGGLIAWTVAQSAYGNVIAALLWFTPYVPGETLAVFYLCGGIANAAATLRASPVLSCAGLGPTIAFLLGLPIIDYVLDGARNSLDLMPLVGALLLLGFGVNLWRSLVASDAAQAQAQAAVIRERQAAAAAAAAKSDMIRRMNAELRTPMMALIGAAEHLRRAAATPQARAHIATLAQAGEVLKLVLDDLSDLDRLENGELRIKIKPADPREIVRGVVSAFKPAAQDKQIELFLDIAPDTPAQVEIDPLRVRQVMFNLVANAVRFTIHGGVRVTMGVQPAGDGRVRLSFTVADTGAGMSRAQLAGIFGHNRLSLDGDGPGLGLSISLRLARLMGGQLQARSELGQGSVFAFTLDAAVAAARSAA